MTEPVQSARVVVVTGASSDLGAALIRELAAHGCHVAGIAGDAEGFADIEADCAKGHFRGYVADVTDVSALRHVAAQIQRDLGPVSVLINNTSVKFFNDFLSGPAEEVQLELSQVLGGYINATAAILPAMVQRGRGRIINITSFSGEAPVPGSLGYSVAKGGCRAFHRALVCELEARLPAITVSEWMPGILRTAIERPDGTPPHVAAVWGAALALDDAPDLHGATFLQDRQMVPERGIKRRVKDAIMLRRPPGLRILSGVSRRTDY